MKRFIFNNYYILRHDKKRTFILSQGASIATPKHLPVNTYWQSMVHPVYAMMLAFFRLQQLLLTPVKIYQDLCR